MKGAWYLVLCAYIPRAKRAAKQALCGVCSVLGALSADACTGFYVGRKVSADGTTMIGRTVDAAPWNGPMREVRFERGEREYADGSTNEYAFICANKVSSQGVGFYGGGATGNFTDAVSLPWSLVADSIDEVTIPEKVTVIGGNLWAGLGEVVVINGETIVRRKGIAAGFPSEDTSGAISGAEFERIDIIDGKAYLDVSVYTSDTVTNQNWSVATNGVIEVPASGKSGFFILRSKAAETD